MLADDVLYKVALSFLPKIGAATFLNLKARFDNFRDIFKASVQELCKVKYVSENVARNIKNKDFLLQAEKEIEYCIKENIRITFLTDQHYPYRLRNSSRPPLILFHKGKVEKFERQRTLAIVGCRKSTSYGNDFLDYFMKELKDYEVQVISGLAYGIDIKAHEEALKQQIPTLAILANGLDHIYPAAHKKTARQILMESDGLLSEYPSGTLPDKYRFPARNRIIAGMSDAVLVVEAYQSGGALITAELANDANREVFALPGDFRRAASEGCNHLIKNHQAHALTSIQDLSYMMQWGKRSGSPKVGPSSNNWSDTEKKIIQLLSQRTEVGIDELRFDLGMNHENLNTYLLKLEINGHIKALHGKKYKLISHA